MIMSSYLPVVAADYTTAALNVKPHEVIQTEASFSQIQRETLGGALKTITTNTTPKFFVTLKWDYITQTDLTTLMDFYLNSSKGYGISRKFLWVHPQELTTYTVQFTQGVGAALYSANYGSVASITLKVWGTPS